ncbi:MAG: linear amide C-N hydrolase [Acidobacteria bacterium]|nr:linear amide C-N hydrolase [Acidobacteriota bacterium]
MNRFQRIIAGAALTLLALSPAALQAAGSKARETVIAGSPDQFMEVRHVVLKGSDFEIGKQMAAVAMREGIKARKSSSRLLSRSKRTYFARNYPAYFDRMKGTAAAFGLPFEDDQYDFSGLWQSFMPGPACSAVFYPGSTTENGHSLMSRNYDFITGTLRGTAPRPGEMAVMARPYLIEMHPNKGYASLAMSAFDILGGVLDGVNSEGLTVSILDDGTTEGVGREPGDEVGFHEIQCVRYVLDNCKTADEAKAALLSLKHYYTLIPCHYIVGDRFGKSFVFEFSPIRNRCLITDGKGPQCVTNHLVARPVKGREWSVARYQKLVTATTAKTKFSLAEIREINASVAIPPVAARPGVNRTLWYALYDCDARSLNIRFYLGEKPDPADPKKVILGYSEPKEFVLRTRNK